MIRRYHKSPIVVHLRHGEFIVMVSTIVNMPLIVGTIKGLDCLSHGKFNANALSIRPSISSLPHRCMFVVKVSTSDGPIKKLGMSDAECEAVVVAGNFPEAPLVPPIPASPAGTPVITSIDVRRRPRQKFDRVHVAFLSMESLACSFN